MKNELNLAASDNAILPAQVRPLNVNEVSAPALGKTEAARPHILARRAARWARRAAY